MTDDDKKLDQDLAVLDALYHDKGQEAAAKVGKRPRTPERQAKVDAMLARARASLRAAREQAFADAQESEPTEPAKPIPTRIAEMARDVVVSRLRELIQGAAHAGPQPVMQFRKLDELPTSDLRRILADLEAQLNDGDER